MGGHPRPPPAEPPQRALGDLIEWRGSPLGALDPEVLADRARVGAGRDQLVERLGALERPAQLEPADRDLPPAGGRQQPGTGGRPKAPDLLPPAPVRSRAES